MIYDCFLYYDEDILLEMRLNTLEHVVDWFVIVESRYTFTGKRRKSFILILRSSIVSAIKLFILLTILRPDFIRKPLNRIVLWLMRVRLIPGK